MDIQQYWLILKRRWFPAGLVFIAVSAVSVATLLTQKVVYQAEGKIRFTRGDRSTTLTGVGKEMGQFDPAVETNNPLVTEMDVMRTVPIVQKTIDDLKLKDQNGAPLTVKQFLSNLSLSNTRGTDILQVSYRDDEPDQAKAIVNTLISVYLDNHLQENRAEAVAARQFIERQLPEAELGVRQADAILRQFKEENHVANLEEEERAAVTAVEDLRRRIAEAQSNLANANAQSAAFRNQLGMGPQEAITVAAIGQSPGVQEVLLKLQEAESELAVERVRFQDEHPAIQSLEERRANLDLLLNERIQKVLQGGSLPANHNLQIGALEADLIGIFVEAEASRMGLVDQVEALTAAQNAYLQRIRVLPRLEQEQRELNRKLEAAQSTYSLLLQKLHEARIAENQNVGNARVIQEAFVLESPIAPRHTSHLATGGILATLAAIATAMALEGRDKSIRTVQEARDIFGYTLLGVVPFYKNPARFNRRNGNTDPLTPEVIVRSAPNSSVGAAYHMLQANLKFLSSDCPLKMIAVTSSVAGEGKSVVSANLAMARAQLGQKVLLIDADMRCPSQHQIWDLLNDTGLSNIIVEQTPPDAVIKTPVANLDVLTAGVLPPNPTVLIDSHRMANLLEQLSQNYDFIVIDTPALNAAADSPILGRMADGVLLVTQPGMLDVTSAQFAKERLEQTNQNVLGQVINGVLPKNEPASYYYFNPYSYEKQNNSKLASAMKN